MRLWINKQNIEDANIAYGLVATRSKTDPIAQHIKVLFPNTTVTVGRKNVVLTTGTTELVFKLGMNAVRFINSYDKAGQAEPAYVTIVGLENYTEPQPELAGSPS